MPLASRSSVPAEASAEFFAGVAPLTMKLAPGSAWKHGCERRVAHPVVRPGDARAQRKHGAGVEREHAVEAGAELAAGVGAGAGIVGERKAPAGGIGLAVAGGAEALRLDRGVGRDAAVPCREAI